MLTICILRIIIDVSLYMSFFAFLLSAIGPGLTLNVGAVFASACLTGILSCLMGKLPVIVRYLPFAVILFCLKDAATVSDYILVAPLIIYLAVRTGRNDWIVAHETLYKNFSGFFIFYLFFGLFAMLTESRHYLESVSLPYIMIWLILSVYTMRILRIYESDTLSTKFKVINAVSGVIVILAVVLLSSPAAQRVILAAGYLIYRCVFTVLVGAIWCIGQVMSLIRIRFTPGYDRELEEDTIDLSGFGEVLENSTEITPVDLTFLLVAMGIAAATVAAVLILKKMLRSDIVTTPQTSGIRRESISAEKTTKRRFGQIFHKSDNRDKVRNYYRRYLRACEKHDIPVDGSVTSAEICAESQKFMRADSVNALRLIWLPARYSDSSDITAEDVSEAKQAFHELNKRGS